MYSGLKFLVGVLIALFPLWAVAEEAVIPLSITSPDFNTETFETADFATDIPVMAITQFSLHLEGSYQEVPYVDIANPYGAAWIPVYLDMYLGDDVANGWIASGHHQFPEGEGTFDFETVLLSHESGDWSFLLDGVGQIGIEVGPSYIKSYSGQIFTAAGSWGTLTSATLIVTYDSSVPSEEWTWGSVKALYR